MYKEHLGGFKHKQALLCGAELSAASRERVERAQLCWEFSVVCRKYTVLGSCFAELLVASEGIWMMGLLDLRSLDPSVVLHLADVSYCMFSLQGSEWNASNLEDLQNRG